MPKLNRSPLAEVAPISTSALEDYNRYVNERITELRNNTAAYANTGTTPGPLTSNGRVLKESLFIPASTQRYAIGRGKYQRPLFVLLARVGTRGLPAAQANLLAAVAEYTNKGSPNRVAPHIVVGYGGEIVQLVDLQDTTHYLQRTANQPTALTQDKLEDALIDDVIEFTTAHEAGVAGYAAFNDNDVNTGIAFGFIQFNQQKGTLADLMREMHRLDPAKFDDVFGDIADSLLDASWVRSVRTNLAVYRERFVASAQYPVFQRAQRNLARREYWPAAQQAVRRLGIQTQRAYAIAFDTAVQRGPDFVTRVAVPKARAKNDDYQKLLAFATAADTLRDATTLLPQQYMRRRNLLNDSRISDVSLARATAAARVTDPVSDENTVVVLLEGRTGDGVTLKQRDAAAAVLKAVRDWAQIPPTTSRMFGLDMLPGVVTAGENPGEAFSYLDLLSATSALAPSAADAAFREAAPVTAQAVEAAANALRNQLQVSRSKNAIEMLAVLQAYDDVKATARAQNLVTWSRAQHASAAIAEAQEQQKNTAATGAGPQQIAGAAQPMTGMDPTQLRGFLFDFKTGLWNDDKPVGKVKEA